MDLTQEALGQRLRWARERRALTQEQVAEHLSLSRPTVIQIEAGKRSVGSLELHKLSQLFQVSMEELVAGHDSESDAEQTIAMLFRRYREVAPDPETARQLRGCVRLCRQATRLESVLGLTPQRATPPAYPVEPPGTRWEAIEQGVWIAEQERRRLQLGILPARHLVEIIGRQGVRIAKYELPQDVAGIFFIGAGTGAVIIANARHVAPRRLFSYAHELCHLLTDRDLLGTITQARNRDDLVEMRANSFAAHFLMPEDGIRAFLDDLGRGAASRQVQEVLDSWSIWPDGGEASIPAVQAGPLSAQRRSAPVSNGIHFLHAVLLAQHFGTSYEATLYQLLNLKLLNKEHLSNLLSQRDIARSVFELLFSSDSQGKSGSGNSSHHEDEGRGSLHNTVLSLSLDACSRGLIPFSEMHQTLKWLNVPDNLLRQLTEICTPANPRVDDKRS